MSFLSNLFGSIFGQFGGGSPGSQGGPTYVPKGQSDVDSALLNLFSGLSGAIGGTQAAIQPNIASGYLNAPDLGALGKLFSGQLQQQAGNAYGSVAPLQQAGAQTYQTALDPQNALRDRLQQQVTDASRAGTSARGIGMGGEASGIENQAVSNFLQDWQNQQLQRQALGAQTMGSLYDASGRQSQLGNADLSGAFGMGQQGAMWPFTLANAFGGSMNQNYYQPLGNLGAMLGQYMGLGQSGSQSAFGQGGTGLENLTSLLRSPSTGNAASWLGSLFGGGAGAGASASPGLDTSLFFMP